jgi:KDO2-lipid IV(A) lauroyltransferase
MPKLWLLPPAQVLAVVSEVDGEELMKQYLAEGRGVLVLAPHHGNWEMVGLYLGQRYGITSMYLPSDNEAVNELVRHGRSSSGATLVPADTAGVRAVLKVLKKGGVAGMLPDQVPKGAGAEPAPFFGHPAQTMTLASNLLQKTGARAIVVYALRLSRGGFKIVFREPAAGIYSDDLAQSLAGLNASVEATARDCPAQYQWEYKRFKGPARSKSSVYK